MSAGRLEHDASRAARVAERLGIQLALADVELGGGRVDVWYGAVSRIISALGVSVAPSSDAEMARADACSIPEDRARYLATRRVLRCVLHDYHVEIDPVALRFETGRHGKLALHPEHGGRVHFNLTHSGDLVAVAVSEHGAVGVDAEAPRHFRDLDRLVHRMLTHSERTLLERAMADGLRREDAFRRVWTVKEARIKALGLPVGAALSRVLPEAEALPWTHVTMPEWSDYFVSVALVPEGVSDESASRNRASALRHDGSGAPASET